MALNIKNALKDLGFTPEQVEALAPNFGADQIAALEARYLDPSEKKRITDEGAAIATTRAELEAANERLNAEMADWATMTASEKASSGQLQSDLEATRNHVAMLMNRLQTMGVDPATVVPAAAAKKEPEVAPTVDTSKFVSREDHAAVARFNMLLPSKLLTIARQHHALTGEDLDTDAIVSEIQVQAGKKDGNVDPVAIWERMHGIAAKREAKQKADYDAAIAAAESRGAERVRTEQSMPPSAIPGRHAPVFGARGQNGSVQPRASALKRPQPETGVRQAAAAFASGKYRTKAS